MIIMMTAVVTIIVVAASSIQLFAVISIVRGVVFVKIAPIFLIMVPVADRSSARFSRLPGVFIKYVSRI